MGRTVVTDSGTTLVVPDRDMVVVSQSLGDQPGAGETVALLHAADGGTALNRDGHAYAGSDEGAKSQLRAFEERAHQPATGDIQALAVGKCDAAAPYSLLAKWASHDYGWFYNSSGQPSTGSLARFQAAGSTIAGGLSTTCGILSNGLSVVYAGAIGDPPAVTPTGCGGFDWNSVVGWGDLSGNTLARTCSYYNPISNTQYVADIMFDTSSRSWFISSSTSGCSNAFDLQGVATHEYGHAVGLGHVDETEPQVMNPYADVCQTDMRQLGRGDQNGLRDHYGS